jgi:hypothetical protein
VVRADDTTRRLAAVESDRQCEIATLSFVDESGFTADLEQRLDSAGLTYRQWKEWHDALENSPDLVAQWTEVSADGCSAG